jgi:FkbH-like protein
MNVSGYEAQAVLFAARPSRLALQQLELDVSGSRGVSINVWRNHAIEPVIASTPPYFACARCVPDFRLSDYDDALMFSGRQPADIELLWLDSRRYLEHSRFDDWLHWLIGRIKTLRIANSAPIIVATWLHEAGQRAQLQALTDAIPAIYFADLDAVCNEAGVMLIDSRTAVMAGTPVSNAAQLVLARKLACQWIPATIFPPIKVVALDLDNTLHAGVLGEDGLQGVRLTPAHQTLQRFLKALRQRGVFLALLSRNESLDVEALFAERDDYPLSWEDFSVTEISWRDKADGVSRIAKALRVAADSILFVDDNLGELASVASQAPQVHTVYASQDPTQTQRAIEYYPGLWRWKIENDDAKRVQDLKANAEREKLLAEMTDPSDYFRSLQVTLLLRLDPSDQLSRLADLCGKTNQFNLAIRRFNQAELAERMECSDACVASVQLKDRLSDSGVIAVIVAQRDGERLTIEELCISCRAMGRHLEDTVIATAIREMPVFAGCCEVVFRAQQGPRNQPALDWLMRTLCSDTRPEPGLHPVPAERLRQFVLPGGITLTRTDWKHGS